MKPRRDLLAALRRLAEHPATPETEAENACRRIAEIEAKHPEARQDRGADEFHFGYGVEYGFVDLDDLFSQMRSQQRRGPSSRARVVSDFAEWMRDFGGFNVAPPFHQNCRCSVGPDYKWIAFEASSWMACRAEGPLGRVSQFEVYRDEEDRHTVVAWPCPVCGAKTTYGIADGLLMYASMEPMARERIRIDVFTRLNGDSDNRCARCTRNSGVEGGGR